MKPNQHHTGLEIAITGMACRVPGASNWREFWDNLVNGVESAISLSEQRLLELGLGLDTIRHRNYVKVKNTIENKDRFDYSFFEYTPAEAGLLNPAHRILHECVWEALEDAGCSPALQKEIGLFMGGGDDLNWRIYSSLKNREEYIDNYTLNLINNKDYLASLIAYKLNLKGATLSVNTACSTSLVAVHLACKSLLLGEVRTALAGGVTLSTEVPKGYFYQEGMTRSADGHCRAFDKEASGIVSGEGAGVVVLKRLTDALNDGDHVYAIIKGSAISNDGNRKVGFTAPSVDGQVECIRKAQVFAGVSPETITYIETHGTGTRLGDPIELEALNIAFNRNKGKTCAIGSLKTNIGHLDTAAGVAGLIKAALCLKYRQLPPSRNFNEPNPEVDFGGGPFYVNTQLKEWRSDDNAPLRAGVSSFGIGGTNAHVILEEAPEYVPERTSAAYKLLLLSARTEDSLNRYADRLKNFLEQNRATDLDDMSYTFSTGRKHFLCRRSISYRTLGDLLSQLVNEQLSVPVHKCTERYRPIVFMFPGQGSQYAGMCRGIYENDRFFKQQMDTGFDILESLTGEDLREILFPVNEDDERINTTRYTQPLIFLVEYCLASLMMNLGVRPDYMIGHSVGEYVAACLSGVFSFEVGLRLIVKRGDLMNSLPRGAMVSIALTPGEAAAYLSDTISLAAINGPGQVVLSGDIRSITALTHKLGGAGITYITLHTSHAFHSAMLDNMLDEFRNELLAIDLEKPVIPFLSNLSGELIRDDEATSYRYWLRHTRETVNFHKGVQTLLSLSAGQQPVFVEVGAGHTLSKLLKQQLVKPAVLCCNLVRTFRENCEDMIYLTDSIGRLWTYGVDIDWSSYYSGQRRRRISLPTYCFEDARFPAEVDLLGRELWADLLPGLTREMDKLQDWIYYPVWKSNALVRQPEKETANVFLFFAHDRQYVSTVTPFLLKEGDILIKVFPGAAYRKVSGTEYIIDPVDVSGFAMLLNDIRQDSIEVTDIIYSWGIGIDPGNIALNKDNRDLHLAYFGLVHIIQSYLQSDALKGKRIVILTGLLHKVFGTERGSEWQSLLLGLLNTLIQEQRISAVNIDVDLLEPVAGYGVVLSASVQDADSRQHRIVAIRNGKRWVLEYEKNREPVKVESDKIKPGGVYLITGGLGNVGFMLAGYLMSTYKAQVILTGRRSLQSINTEEDALRKINYLSSLGGTVKYFSLDIADLSRLEALIADMENTIGKIDGVIHAAGIIDNAYFELIETVTEEKALRMFEAKIKGIENIYNVFKHRNPDFVWITSSLSTVLGGLGFSTYSSANLFMDYFVSSRADELKGWRCIGLGGMAFTEELINQQNAHKRSLLLPSEITDLFEWSLSLNNTPLLITSLENLPARIEEVYGRQVLQENEKDTISGDRWEQPVSSTDYIQSLSSTEEKLIAIYENFFGIEGIGPEGDFFEIGGDSLKGMMLLKRIRNVFAADLTIKEFFEKTTIREVAAKIDEHIYAGTSSNMQNEIII